MKPYSIHDMPGEFVESYGKGDITLALSALAGGERLNVSLERLPPGGHSAKYHAHSRQEEFFFILSGSGVLRTAEGERPVKAGDFMAKPASPAFDNPHNFFNPGPQTLEILDIELLDAGDVAYYPDEDVYYLRGGRPAFSGGNALRRWTPEPDVDGENADG